MVGYVPSGGEHPAALILELQQELLVSNSVPAQWTLPFSHLGSSGGGGSTQILQYLRGSGKKLQWTYFDDSCVVPMIENKETDDHQDL